ncbi:MAG: hypothetical protein MJZ76_00865 [Bacteroidales bacterium]|nr:hypothetical protein [Bacteroidales bacterium]
MKTRSTKRNFTWDWSSFLMNLVAVILGIAITFMVQKLIDEKQEKKTIAASLTLVRDELSSNLEQLIICDSVLKIEKEAALFLIRFEDDFDKAPQDSLYYYCNVPVTLRDFVPTTDALELQKNAALLQKIKDQQLALNIIQIYALLESYSSEFSTFYEMKSSMMEDAMGERFKQLMTTEKFTASEFWAALLSTDEGKIFLHEIPRKFYVLSDMSEGVAVVREVISQIDEYIAENN